MHENKKTGIGVEDFCFSWCQYHNQSSVCTRQTIRHKGNDTVANYLVVPGNTAALMHEATNPVGKTDKGFGVGITHDLGGGATLAAGFGKVKKQNHGQCRGLQ